MSFILNKLETNFEILEEVIKFCIIKLVIMNI